MKQSGRRGSGDLSAKDLGRGGTPLTREALASKPHAVKRHIPEYLCVGKDEHKPGRNWGVG